MVLDVLRSGFFSIKIMNPYRSPEDQLPFRCPGAFPYELLNPKRSYYWWRLSSGFPWLLNSQEKTSASGFRVDYSKGELSQSLPHMLFEGKLDNPQENLVSPKYGYL